MALQFSTTYRNDMLDRFEAVVGTSPILEIRTGAAPANCAAASTGTLLASITCPSDWMGAAAAGAKALSGTWTDSSANATGTAAHFRLFDSTGTTCHMQGTVTITGGGGDMTVDNTSFATGQAFTVSTFTLTAPGA